MENQAEIRKHFACGPFGAHIVNIAYVGLVTLFVSAVVFRPENSNASCLTTAEMQSRLQESMDSKCGKGIKWDLAEFVPDDSICDSRKQGLNLIQQVFEASCRDDKAKSELRSKITLIKVNAHLAAEAQYTLNGKTLGATVPIKEVPILTNWTEHQAQLREFVRRSTGIAFMSNEEAEVAEREGQFKSQKADAEKAKRQWEQAARDRETAIQKREADREVERIAREKKIAEINDKLKKATEEFQKASQAIWARPGNTPQDTDRKLKDHAEALEKFNRSQAEFTAEVQNIN